MGNCLSADGSAAAGRGKQRPPLLRAPFRRDLLQGIVCVQLLRAQMGFEDRWFACISLGEQTFRTATTPSTDAPAWNSQKQLVLEKGGPCLARIAVYETNRLTSNTAVGYCELDLSAPFHQHTEQGRSHEEEPKQLELRDPSNRSTIVGQITLTCTTMPPEVMERNFVRSLLSLVDYDGNGQLSLTEFRDLMRAFGNSTTDTELETLYNSADKNQDGTVDADELASLIALRSERLVFVRQCPVCGETLGSSDALNDVIHMSLCFNQGTGMHMMTGGFLTEKQASYGWMFQLSEWMSYSSYDVGLRSGQRSSHILVFERRTRRLQEELIDSKILLAMRTVYQSSFSLGLLDSGTKRLLIGMSQRQGVRMNSPESVKDIPRFVCFFKDQIDMDDIDGTVGDFKTFNEFFVRKLKAGARPIAWPSNEKVAVCAADSRLMVFTNASKAQRLWIKGRKFSIAGLLADSELGEQYKSASLAVFRLAPQDYHRFHVPSTCTVGAIREVPDPGHLYTVNPIAVNSKYCDVFTENKRAIVMLHTPHFGSIAFVAIGATMVGSITFTRRSGDKLQKGDELGFFSFGGSTCICVFEESAITFDEDLMANSERSLETLVQMGTTLGVARGEQLKGPKRKDSIVGDEEEGGQESFLPAERL